jgi:O-antigen/teichoic acid export membrane protein
LPFAASSLLAGLSGLAALLVFSRQLTPAGYGLFVALSTMVTLVQSGAFFWLQTAILRLHSTRDQAGARERLGAAVKLAFLLSCAAISPLWLAAVLFAAQRFGAGLWLAGLPLALLGGWLGLVRSWNRVTERPWRLVLSDAAQGLGAVAFAFAGLRAWQADPLIAVLGAIGAAILAVCISPALLRIGLPRWRKAAPVIAELWAYGAPLTLGAFLASALAVSDRLLVALIVGPGAAGTYGAGYAIADRAIGLALAPIAFAMKPLIFAAFDSAGEDAARRLGARSAQWLMAIGFPVATMLACAPAPIAGLLVGGGMAPGAAAILPWVAVGAMLAAMVNLHLGLAFQLSRRTGAMLAVVGPAAAANFLANLVLLPLYGAIAAAWTTVGAYALALLLAIHLGRRHVPVPVPPTDIVVTLAACVPLAILLRFQPGHGPAGWLLVGALGMAVYVGALMLLRRLARVIQSRRSVEPVR